MRDQFRQPFPKIHTEFLRPFDQLQPLHLTNRSDGRRQSDRMGFLRVPVREEMFIEKGGNP